MLPTIVVSILFHGSVAYSHSLFWIVPYSVLHHNTRVRFLGPILATLHGEDPVSKVCRLLSDEDPYVTHMTALFARAAKVIRSKFLESIVVDCNGDF